MGELTPPKSCIYRWHFPFHNPAELGKLYQAGRTGPLSEWLSASSLPDYDIFRPSSRLSDDLFRGHVIAIKQVGQNKTYGDGSSYR